MPDPKRNDSLMSGFGQAMGVSAELVTTTAVGTTLGWLADRGLHTHWVFAFIGALLGGAGGILRVSRSWKKKPE